MFLSCVWTMLTSLLQSSCSHFMIMDVMHFCVLLLSIHFRIFFISAYMLRLPCITLSLHVFYGSDYRFIVVITIYQWQMLYPYTATHYLATPTLHLITVLQQLVSPNDEAYLGESFPANYKTTSSQKCHCSLTLLIERTLFQYMISTTGARLADFF